MPYDRREMRPIKNRQLEIGNATTCLLLLDSVNSIFPNPNSVSIQQMTDNQQLGLRKVRRALISVSDKTGIVEFAREP